MGGPWSAYASGDVNFIVGPKRVGDGSDNLLWLIANGWNPLDGKVVLTGYRSRSRSRLNGKAVHHMHHADTQPRPGTHRDDSKARTGGFMRSVRVRTRSVTPSRALQAVSPLSFSILSCSSFGYP